MSWHEDFAKNISRFFFRSKSVETESSGSELREADGSASTCSVDLDQTSEQHLNTAASLVQESQASDVPDGNCSSQPDDGGNEGGSAPPNTSTAPPADGFLRRLGSLLHLSRAEPVRIQRESRLDEDRVTVGQTDTQERGGRVEPEPHSQLTQSEEPSEEDGIDAISTDTNNCSEEKRLQDLSCPPVVTYGTYRGLKEVRKPKKKHCLELHSPISEGEEATQPDSYENNEISTVNIMSSDCQKYPCSAQRDEDVLAQSVLPAEAPAVGSPAHQFTCLEMHPAYRIPQAEPSLPNEPANSKQVYVALETTSGDADGQTLSGTKHHNTLPTPEEQQKPSVTVDRTDPDAQTHQCLEKSELSGAELDSGVDEDLRVESKKIVDDILTNAVAALQKIEVSEIEHNVQFSSEHDDHSESGLIDSCSDAERKFCVMLSDQTLSVALEEAQVGNRSPPSSGYESITGSDTDIRCVVGVASDFTPTAASIGSQNETQGVFEYSNAGEMAFCKNRGRNPLSGSAGDNELLSTVHTQKSFLQKKDIKLFLPALSEEYHSQEQHTGDVRIEGEKRSQGSAKDSAMIDNCRQALNASHVASTITLGAASSGHQEDLHQSQTLSDPFISHVSVLTDSDTMSEVPCQPLAIQSHESEETEAPHSGGSKQEQMRCESGTKLSVAEVQSSGAQLHPSQWVSVRALLCEVSEDQSLSPEEHLKPELSENRAEGGEFPVSPSGLRNHLNPLCSRTAAVIPQHSRFHDLDLHHVDGGFAIISEEEESDVVFVNDTGSMHSPSMRRAKVYPFSLSPIYEESAQEEGLGQETLQVPPATKEEERSIEQPAASILSLLQSVSEKLQSSVICSSEDESLSIDCYSHRDDSQEDGNPSVLLIPAEARPEPNAADDAPERIEQERDGGSTLADIGKNVNTPFYQYLKSTLTPSTDGHTEDTERAVSHTGGSTMVVGEMGGFGKVNLRPAAVLIYEGGGERRQIHTDVEDAGRDLFAQRGTLYALRGCWVLYANLRYHGSCVLLEEGQTVKASTGTQQKLEEDEKLNRTDLSDVLSVGSIRILKDDDIPEIHLHPSSPQTVCLHSATDLTEQHGSVFLSDFSVKTGYWLLCERSGFSGSSALLEADGRLTLLQHSPPSRVRSLRPLQMGGPRVTRPLDPKVLLFQKPQFQGQCWEVLDHSACLNDMEGPVSSLRVTGGIWVGFSSVGFRGHQCVLEEGEYSDCSLLFGGSDLSIQSLRHVQTDFLEPSLCLKTLDQEISVRLEIPDLQETDGICVKSGVWVAYSDRCFTGDQCVLEKGLYPGQLQWGDRRGSVRSLRPIHRELCWIEEPKFLLRVYSQIQFGGESRDLHNDVPNCSVPVLSLRVIRGSWLLFDEEHYCGNQYILGEGLYPDLTSCGCSSTAIKSLKTLPYTFSEPSVSLFSLSAFQGLEEACCSVMEDVSQLFCQSVRVSSGLWVAFEYAHFKGSQMILRPGGYSVWSEHSGWETIGSLKPIRQPKGFFHLRNRALGLVLTAENLPSGSFPANVFLSPADRLLETQRWIFSDGLLKNTAQMGCLSVIGAKACAGARVALWEEHGRVNQRWSVNEHGRISSHLNHRLVLELTGECSSDRLILSPICTDDDAQIWDIEVL